MSACEEGHTTCVAARLDAGADYHDSGGNDDGYTALHMASMYGCLDTMELLLKRGQTQMWKGRAQKGMLRRCACLAGRTTENILQKSLKPCRRKYQCFWHVGHIGALGEAEEVAHHAESTS
ncbi:unnamed protein product [Chrysoparadoxa australica]